MQGGNRASFACVAWSALSVIAPLAHAQSAGASNNPRPSTAAGTSSASNTAAGASAAPNASTPPVAAPIGDPLADLRLVPIDPGTEDVSILREGGRQMPVDLRKPLNFEQVYRVEGDLSRLGVLGISPAPGQSMYARASGGLIAVFPQSEYVRTRQGAFPIVPANTTFLLGSAQTLTQLPKDSALAGGVTAASAAQRVDLRARVTTEPVPMASRPPRREAGSIWESEVTRRSRLEQLLDQASKVPPIEHDAAQCVPSPDPLQSPTPAADPAPAPAQPPAAVPPVTPASDP